MLWTQKERFTGLEIEPGYIKLAQAQDFGQLRKIAKLIVKRLASPSEKELVETFKNILGELKGQIGHLNLSIPRHKVTVRFLDFPTINEKEIEGMVRLQSVKELPFSKEEIISDYLIIERTKEGYAKVALVIVHQDEIKWYLDILKKVNLEPERITFSTEAILNWYKVSLRQKMPKGSSILVDIDSDYTDIVILDNSHLVFTRSLGLGAVQLKQQPDLKDKLVEEIKRTIEGYTRLEKEKKVGRIFLVRQDKIAETLKSFLEQEINLSCEVFSPLENLNCLKGVSAGQYESGLSLLRVLGMALDRGEKKLNLLPKVMRQKQELRLRRKRTYSTLLLLLTFILLTLLVLVKKIHDKQLYILSLDREIKKTAPLAKDVENMLQKIELIEMQSKIKGSSIDILRQLHQLVPPDIALSSFNYEEEDKMVTLQGISTNRSEVFTLIDTLKKSGYFRNVQLKYASEKKGQAADVTDFKIECNLE